MESIQKQLVMLIEEGEKFTFSNFCLPDPEGGEYGGPDSPQWLTWKTRSANLIKQVVAEDSAPMKMLERGLRADTEGNYQDEFDIAKNNIIEALQKTLEITKRDTFNELRKSSSKSTSTVFSNKIFVVHGHDHALKTEVENFLHAIGLEPIVLHKKPDEGQTIIEKFERHSDVGYAFILLTPDEITYTIDQDKLKDKERKKEVRARPNVIFEFGYFVGKLGRNRVCCLYKGDVTLPSDLSGLIYKKIVTDVESEGFSLIKELKAAGYRLQF
jgi:predicted nucleotide-binding protein